jgi:epimerase transport system membrane fusion protein
MQASNSDRPDWLHHDRRLLRVGYSAVALLFLFGGFWLGCAPLESAALAPGVVQVQGKRKSIEHLEGGIIAEILVKNGDAVLEMEPLLRLDATRDRAELQILTGRLYNTEALVARLKAERDDRATIVWPDELTAAAGDGRAEEAMANESALFSARLDDRLGEEGLINQTIAQQRQQLDGLKSLADSKDRIIGSLGDEIEDLADLLSEGYVDKQRLRELERARDQHVGDLSDLAAKIGAVQIAIDESMLRVTQLRMRFKTDVVAQLSESQARLFDIKQQHAAAADRVERATIKAPVEGVVLGLTKNTVGEVISPGEQLLELVPQLKNFVVEAKVSPMDIDRIHVGQLAEIRFSVFKDAYTITGSLKRISADTLYDKNTGLDYYSAEVEILSSDFVLLDGLTLFPGMPADVLIKTGNRTMLSYLSSPLRRMFARSLIEE